MKALYFEDFGTSEVLKYGELPEPKLKEDEVLVQTAYIGLNFADIYRRRGTYHIEKNIPYINGYEASGEIVAAGSPEMMHLIGRRVLFVDAPFANAEFVAVVFEKLIFLPAEIDMKTAASIGLQGLTAIFLAHDLGRNLPDDKVFITGISGGVGQILAQLLISDGVKVYGSASTPEKRQLALDFGACEVLPSRENTWLSAYKGQFDTVYDGTGSTLNQSITLLKHRGSVVFFGMAGGNPPLVNVVELLSESKNILTGDLWDYLPSFEGRERRSKCLFGYFLEGKIKLSEPMIFDLKDGKDAHDYLESGQSAGKILLKP